MTDASIGVRLFAPLLLLMALLAPSVALGQAADGNKVEQKAGRAESAQKQSAEKSTPTTRVDNGEKPNQSDCGTPQECRAEERDKEALVAQKVAAEAAVAQANLSRWQTFIGTLGVIAVIATLIYTHMATKAAVGSVTNMQKVEMGRLCIMRTAPAFTLVQGGAVFNLMLSNYGKINAILKASGLGVQSTNNFSDFAPIIEERHNTVIEAEPATIHSIQIPAYLGENLHIAGYYEWATVFGDKRYRDYFCLKFVPDKQLPLIDVMGTDWPPDSV